MYDPYSTLTIGIQAYVAKQY